MTRIILIMGQLPDPHISAVATILTHMGAKVLVFDRLHAQQSCRLSYDLGPMGCSGVLYVNEERCNLADVHSVWWRVKPVTLADMTGWSLSSIANFVRREWQSVLDSLEFFTQQARWVNPRAADLKARNKPTQLLVAREVGFTIPSTLISNDSSSVVPFLTDAGAAHVYKVLTWYFDPPDQMIFTSHVDADRVNSDPQSISVAPGIFQMYIPKAYEVRATVVGDKIFAVRLDSQAHDDTRLDWRRNQDIVPYSQLELPGDIRKLLLAMNHRLGLVYAAYDLIVTPSGKYVFLEVNPLGQWLWLENATGVPICQSLAEALLVH